MAEYYYTQGTDRHGPIDLAELQSLVTSGQVSGTEYYWTTGMADWATVNTSSLFSAPDVPSPSDVETPTMDALATEPVADVPSPGDPIPSTLTGVPPGDTSPSPTVPAAGVTGATTAATWSPSPVSAAPVVQSDQGTVQRIAAKMPKPLWLIVNGIVTGLSGVFLILGIFTIPFAAVVIWMAVMLFKANTSLENARRTGSLESLEKAASNLNTYFAIITIMTILSIVITLIAFVAIGASLSEFTRF